MLEYPASGLEFEESFKSEENCIDIISVRWPKGLVCPKCQNDKFCRNHNGLDLECSSSADIRSGRWRGPFFKTRLSL
jgi:hypothetical protein